MNIVSNITRRLIISTLAQAPMKCALIFLGTSASTLIAATLVAANSSTSTMQQDHYSAINFKTRNGFVNFKVRTDLLERGGKAIPDILIIRCSYPGFQATDSTASSHIRIVIREIPDKTSAERLAEADHKRPGRVVERFVGSKDGFDVFERSISGTSAKKTTIYLKNIDGYFVSFEDPPLPFRTISVERRFKDSLVVEYQVDKEEGRDFLALDRNVMRFLNDLTK